MSERNPFGRIFRRSSSSEPRTTPQTEQAAPQTTYTQRLYDHDLGEKDEAQTISLPQRNQENLQPAEVPEDDFRRMRKLENKAALKRASKIPLAMFAMYGAVSALLDGAELIQADGVGEHLVSGSQVVFELGAVGLAIRETRNASRRAADFDKERFRISSDLRTAAIARHNAQKRKPAR